MINLDILFKSCKTIFFENIIEAVIIEVIPCQYTENDFDELLVLQVDADTIILRRFAEVQINT